MAAMGRIWAIFVAALVLQAAPQQKPTVPVAAGAIVANLDRYAGTTVSVTAAVVQRYGATAFSVAQTRSAARKTPAIQDVLIVAPLLTAPVQPGAYVTVIGEVVKFDPAVVAARMKDAAPPPDVAAKYAGKPAVLATSVINQSMTDLAKKLPPPMTPAEIELNKAMKQISPAFAALRQAVTASNTSDARDQATTLANGFTAAAAFWKTQPHPEAVAWTEDARKLADEIAMLAAKPDLEGLKASVPKLQQVCSNCHNQYRVRLDDGSYRYKDAVAK
jgi:cytochrome c556